MDLFTRSTNKQKYNNNISIKKEKKEVNKQQIPQDKKGDYDINRQQQSAV